MKLMLYTYRVLTWLLSGESRWHGEQEQSLLGQFHLGNLGEADLGQEMGCAPLLQL